MSEETKRLADDNMRRVDAWNRAVGERPDAIPEGIDLMICECGARWFGGNTKYCPSGHAYRFRTERYVRAAHPEAGGEEGERLRDAARAFVRETGVAHPAIARIPADAPAAVRYDQTRAALLALLDAHPEAPGEVETVARLFHDTYERLAPDFGYRTREESAKPWEEVPEQNRALMCATVAVVLDADRAPGEVEAAARWRVGRKVGRTIYLQFGDEPSDDDPLIGVMDTPGLAAQAVDAVRGRSRDDTVAEIVQRLRQRAALWHGGEVEAAVIDECADFIEREYVGAELRAYDRAAHPEADRTPEDER